MQHVRMLAGPLIVTIMVGAIVAIVRGNPVWFVVLPCLGLIIAYSIFLLCFPRPVTGMSDVFAEWQAKRGERELNCGCWFVLAQPGGGWIQYRPEGKGPSLPDGLWFKLSHTVQRSETTASVDSEGFDLTYLMLCVDGEPVLRFGRGISYCGKSHDRGQIDIAVARKLTAAKTLDLRYAPDKNGFTPTPPFPMSISGWSEALAEIGVAPKRASLKSLIGRITRA
jgi:hypothetical protein